MTEPPSGPVSPAGDLGRRVKRTLVFVMLTAVVLAAVVVVWLVYPRHPSPDARFLDRKGVLVRADVRDRTVRGGRITEEVVLRSDTGLAIRGLIQLPDTAGVRLPAVIVMGGIESGRRGLRRLPTERYPFLWMCLDYAYELPDGVSSLDEAVEELPRAVDGAVSAVAGILLARDYLESRREVDGDRVVAGGGSLGSFPVTIAAALDERFGAVVLLYGGGDVAGIIEHNLPWESWIKKRLAVAALNPWLGPLEPTRYVLRISPRPLLMVNGTGDTMFPRPCVDALYEAAGDPRELRWLPTEHRIVDRPELMGQALEAAMDWLFEIGFLDGEGG